ncbi:MAG: TPR REGION protein [Candidatus Magasanikbacteria bacterium]|nr:TPR REGION protein [Candidatus Magasanikbacteria bacterium]
MNRGTLLTIIAGVLILAALVGGSYGFKSWKERSLITKIEKQLSTDVKTKDLVAAAVDAASKIASNPTSPQPYLLSGMAWKSVADASKEKYFYQKALDAYKSGIAHIEGVNSILFANAGDMAKELGDYAAAEGFYRQAIASSPGDAGNYISLIELYRYRLNKSQRDILAEYEAAMKTVVYGYNLVASRASYLKDIGRYEDALGDFETLLTSKPDSQPIKNEIAELKAIIAQQNLKK